jgi:hypothetical protein
MAFGVKTVKRFEMVKGDINNMGGVLTAMNVPIGVLFNNRDGLREVALKDSYVPIMDVLRENISKMHPGAKVQVVISGKTHQEITFKVPKNSHLNGENYDGGILTSEAGYRYLAVDGENYMISWLGIGLYTTGRIIRALNKAVRETDGKLVTIRWSVTDNEDRQANDVRGEWQKLNHSVSV